MKNLRQDEIITVSGGGDENPLLTTAFTLTGIITAGVFFTNGALLASISYTGCVGINYVTGQNYSLDGLNKAYIKCNGALWSGIILFKTKYTLKETPKVFENSTPAAKGSLPGQTPWKII